MQRLLSQMTEMMIINYAKANGRCVWPYILNLECLATAVAHTWNEME